MPENQIRTIVAFILVIAILLVWSLFTKSKTTTNPVAAQSVAADTTLGLRDPERSLTYGDTLVIDRPAYRAVLASAGASLKSFILKQYHVELLPDSSCLFITRIAGTDSIFNFSRREHGDSVIFSFRRAADTLRTVYVFNDDPGFTVATYGSPSGRTLSLRSGLRITETKNRADDLNHFAVYVKSDNVNNITRLIKDSYEQPSPFSWFSMRNKYFAIIVDNVNALDAVVFNRLYPTVYRRTTQSVSVQGVDQAYFGCAFGGRNSARFGAEIRVHDGSTLHARFMPLRYNQLAAYHRDYQSMASLGLWGFISRLILVIFKFFYSLFHNYGVAIILFAILLKTLFFPLSKQMIISQHRMQMIQPEIKKIQERFKDDAAAMNQEVMHLYRAYKVNPFTGCLPLLIQFPIFMALYQTLNTSIEFRQAQFAFWLNDLAVKDPYYVLPVGMGVMMLIQSLMTPVDPRQRFMVMLMPIFMIFIFLNLPSGLQLYWFTFNILTLVENYLVKRGGLK